MKVDSSSPLFSVEGVLHSSNHLASVESRVWYKTLPQNFSSRSCEVQTRLNLSRNSCASSMPLSFHVLNRGNSPGTLYFSLLTIVVFVLPANWKQHLSFV